MINRAAEFALRNDQAYVCVAGKIDGGLLDGQDEIYEFIEDDVAHSPGDAHFLRRGALYSAL